MMLNFINVEGNTILLSEDGMLKLGSEDALNKARELASGKPVIKVRRISVNVYQYYYHRVFIGTSFILNGIWFKSNELKNFCKEHGL